MTTLNSTQAQAMLPNYTFDDICVLARRNGYPRDEILEKTLWLGHLCMMGKITSVKEYLANLDFEEKKEILNKTLEEFFGGTVLHQTLYWNSGNTAIDLFQLLAEHGAEPCLDGYDAYPWNVDGVYWIPIFHTSIGTRDSEEFEESNSFLREIYDTTLPPFENKPMALAREPVPRGAPIAARRLIFSDEDEKEEDVSTKFAKVRLVYSDEEDFYDMPALVDSDNDEDYSDMPALIDSKM